MTIHITHALFISMDQGLEDMLRMHDLFVDDYQRDERHRIMI